MKKLVVILAILTSASVVSASPFLICDPQAGVTHYKLTGPAWVPSSVPAQPDGSIKLDLVQAVDGPNALTVAACIAPGAGWPTERCSLPVPFEFTRPPQPATTKGIKLIP